MLLLGAALHETRQISAQQDGAGAQAARVLWRDPGPIVARDLSWASDPAHQPPSPPFAFLKEDTSGTRPKVRVKNSQGTIRS